MFGGLAIGVKRKYEFERTLKLMSAVRYSISEADYPLLCKRKEVDVQMNRVRVVDYYRGGSYRIEEVLHGL